MEAVCLVAHGNAQKAFAIKTVNQPTVGDTQVKIKVEAFGLNFADVMARKGLYRDAPALPAILGYEVVGEVVEQGALVNENLKGKRVLAFTRFGGYAQFAVTQAQAVIVVGANDDAAKLLALATQYSTAWYAANIATTVQPNDVVLQHAAAGGVGMALIQLCKLKQAKIIGLTSSEAKVKRLLDFGCDAAINYTQQNYEQVIRDTYKHVDVSFNSVAGATFKKDLRLLNYGGRLVCYGAADRLKGGSGLLSTIWFVAKMGRIVPVKLLMRSNSLIGVNMLRIADYRPDVLQTCMQEVYALYVSGKINPFIWETYAVQDIAKAHEVFELGQTTGKLVVRW